MNIAVYTGSFNPLHIGHLAIMKCLTETMDFDMVYLVVSPQSPFKDAALASSGAERYRSAIEAVERHPELKVSVDDIELGMPAPNYTVNTLKALSAREPENRFTLVMGADNLNGIRGWKDYRKILTEYGVAVYPRKGFDLGMIKDSLMEESPDYKIQAVNAPVIDISSTEIREALAAGKDMGAFLM